ncbi:MAG: anti-sigma factor family protein [Actinomycetota bacterium]
MSRDNEHLDLEALSDLIDRAGAPAHSRREAERHLASCAQCAARKAGLESAAKAVASLAKVSPTAEETRAMRMAVLDAKPRRRLARWPAGGGLRAHPVLASSGALALILAAVISFLAVNGGPGAVPTAGPAAKAPTQNQKVAAAPRHAAPETGTNGDVNPQPSSSAGVPIVVFSGGTAGGGALFAPALPAAGPSFTSKAQVASYVAGQDTVYDEAQALTAGSASIVNASLLQSLGGTGLTDSAAGGVPPTPSAPALTPFAAPSPAATPTTVTATNSAGGGTTGQAVQPAQPAPAAPALPSMTLAACVEQVLTFVPKPAAALEATPVTYLGSPAWLIVLATSPTTTTSPSETLTRERFWVQSEPACMTLTMGTV